jgi:ferredoxin
VPTARRYAVADLRALLEHFRETGHRLVGPRLRDRAIVYDEIAGIDDLPMGWSDTQAPGRYRLEHRGDRALFAFNNGAGSCKAHLFPARLRLFTAERAGERIALHAAEPDAAPVALVGVRACDLAAIAIHDRVLTGGAFADPDYTARRAAAVVIAVNCSTAAETCFCGSMGTGPRAGGGYDLVLTERIEADRHDFLVEAGSARGAELLAAVPGAPASVDDRTAADAMLMGVRARTEGRLDAGGLPELLADQAEHPRWDDVARRCISCGNCTMVCPTCFCTTTEDATDLAGARAERRRVWDTCFDPDHSYIHGGTIRRTTRSRYRQWLTHKLGTWQAQFGTSGCVGCGRCITWCPVGIDITAEVAALRTGAGAPARG